VDYQLAPRRIVFRDVCFFQYADIDADPRDLPDDGVYEVRRSTRVDGLVRVGDVVDTASARHIVIRFNERGMFLELAFGIMEPPSTL
jgi:hypothetical protein